MRLVYADNIRTVAISVKAAEEQGAQISKFVSNHGLGLNKSKTEVVKFSTNTTSCDESINLMESSIYILLGYIWDRSLSAKSAVKDNISRARKLFFALGSTGCYLERSNPLTAKSIVETCVFPTLLYGA